MAKRRQKAARTATPPAHSAAGASGSREAHPKVVLTLIQVGGHLAKFGNLDGKTRGALRATCAGLRQALAPCARLAAADITQLTDGDFPDSCVELRIDGKLKDTYAGYLVGADWPALESLRVGAVGDALPILARKKFPKLRRLRIDRVEGSSPNFEPLKRLHAAQLEELHVAGVPEEAAGRGGGALATRLANACTALRSLSLRKMGLDHLAADRILQIKSLQALDLSGNRGLRGGIGASVVAAEVQLPELRELDLGGIRLTKGDVAVLGESDFVCGRARRLALGLAHPNPTEAEAEEAPDAADVVALLDALGGNGGLEELALELPTGTDAAHGFGGVALRALRVLRLSSVDAPSMLFEALGRATLPALRVLDVAGSRGGGGLAGMFNTTGSLEVLARPDALPRLERLALSGMALSVHAGACANLRSLFRRLQAVSLERLSLMDAEMDAIFTVQRPKREEGEGDEGEGEEGWALQELSLSGNIFKAQGLAQLLAAAPHMPALRSLRLLHCKYSAVGTRFLLAAATAVFPALSELGMDVNKDAAPVLAEGWRWRGLDALEFTHANVSEQALLREAFPGVRVTFA